MSLLQLQIDIDSDVHPELHAALGSIAREPACGERLRQLAASGLIWEHLRAHAKAQAALAMGPPAETGRADAAAPPAAAAPATAGDTGAPIADAASRKLPRGEIPVLRDAIDLEHFAWPDGSTSVRDTSVAAGLHAVGSDVAAPLSQGTDSTCSAPAADRTATVRRLGPRPRLLRMKEKGLFRNGPDD